MREWEEECGSEGVNLVCESVIANEAPGDEDLEKSRALGKALS